MDNNSAYLDWYEKKLTDMLLAEVKRHYFLDDDLLRSDDLDDKWKEVLPFYMADAIPQIPKYPVASLAWAVYVGMAFAAFWDTDWKHYNTIPNLYVYLREQRGFDLLDEYVLYEVLSFVPDALDTMSIENLIRKLAYITLDMIRKEEIEPQSHLAFYVYSRSVTVLFEFGVAIELKHRKYKYERIDLNRG